jgi:hypothetical protein
MSTGEKLTELSCEDPGSRPTGCLRDRLLYEAEENEIVEIERSPEEREEEETNGKGACGRHRPVACEVRRWPMFAGG